MLRSHPSPLPIGPPGGPSIGPHAFLLFLLTMLSRKKKLPSWEACFRFPRLPVSLTILQLPKGNVDLLTLGALSLISPFCVLEVNWNQAIKVQPLSAGGL